MAQLDQLLWSNIMWGACGIFFMLLFGVAVQLEWNSQLTPKAWNRPRNVLKNVLKQHPLFGCMNFYPITWYLWARKLSYPLGGMSAGIPGTGTRDDGWTGPTLHMNLDGVILLKYHRMLFKISLVASILCCGVLLPTYTTSVCNPTISNNNSTTSANLNSMITITHRECERLTSLTDFEQLTILSIPEVNRQSDDDNDNDNSYFENGNSNSNSTSSSIFDDYDDTTTNTNFNSTRSINGRNRVVVDPISERAIHKEIQELSAIHTTSELLDENGNIIIPPAPTFDATQHNANSKWIPGITWRLVLVAICSAIIYLYTCYLLWYEWIDNLQLRRQHFLESDHYQTRMDELHHIANLQQKFEDPIIARRPPFVPHPEMREIPPSVGLYSVLYQLPSSLVTFDTDGETQMDRQLVATVQFFNECVPPPTSGGLTSSVVAATIVPDAARVAKVWKKWYRLEAKCRMVRYIRKIIQTKQLKFEKDGTTDIYVGCVATYVSKLKRSSTVSSNIESKHTNTNRTIAAQAQTVIDTVTTSVQKAKIMAASRRGSVRIGIAKAGGGGMEMTNINNNNNNNNSAEEKESLMSSSTHLSTAAAAKLHVATVTTTTTTTIHAADNDNINTNTDEENGGILCRTASLTNTGETSEEHEHGNSNSNDDNGSDNDSDNDSGSNDTAKQDHSGFWQNVFGGGWRKEEEGSATATTTTEQDDDLQLPWLRAAATATATAVADSINDSTLSEEFVEGNFIEAAVAVADNNNNSNNHKHDNNNDIESLQPLSASILVSENHQRISSTTTTTTTCTTPTNTDQLFYGAKTTGFKYAEYDVREYAKTISHQEETELIDVVDGLGIEELSVFAREYAQSSSSPCPFGVAPNLLKLASIEELQERIEDLVEDMKLLNVELIEARLDVIRGQDDDYEVDPTMVSTVAFDGNDNENDTENGGGCEDRDGSSSSSMGSYSSSSSVFDCISSIPRPTSERKTFSSLRNRIVGATTGSAVISASSSSSATTTATSDTTNQWDKAHEVASSSMEEIPEQTVRSGWGLGKSSSSLLSSSSSFCSKSGGGGGSSLFACCKRNPYYLGETFKSIPTRKIYGHMKGAGRAFVTALNHPSYAVVTFSSRQAAIAARQCLADGSGGGSGGGSGLCSGGSSSWQQVDEIPIPPLADAPPRNIFFCRGFCRPVTLTINYKEKKCRRWSVYVFLFFFSCFYTIPLALISIMLNPRWLGYYFPHSKSLHNPDNILYKALAGPVSGLATTLFMALLPQIFKFIAYYEGTSSSLEMAERKALLFMWYFMLVTVFFGQYLATMLIQWYYHAGVTNVSLSLWSTVNLVAGLIPSSIAPAQLNWIIMRYGFIWPAGYFFQMNTFLTKISRLTCLNRVARGGGPGGPTPFRIYVDSGVIFLCVVGLSPMVPIVAPIATIYFIVVQPMLRWLLIFVYRPRYDTGGDKWPLCHQIVISALIMAQILTAVTLALKGSLWCSIFIGCCTFPTFLFNRWTKERFLRAYSDTALLQTSRLDGGQESYTQKEREEFRRWLVDCHKASYVPTCMLGSKENLITVEPAVVIPKDTEIDRGGGGMSSTVDPCGPPMKQKGGIYHRKQRF